MKKLLAILLAALFVFTMVACTIEPSEEDSSVAFGNNSSEEESSVEPSEEDSSDEASSTEESSTESAEATVSQFLTWKNPYYDGGLVGVKSDENTSLPLAKFNEAVEAGENAVLTRAFGATIASEGQDYADFAVAVFEYDHSKFGYVKTAFYEAGSVESTTAIPMDGFVAVISKDNSANLSAVKELSTTTVVYPCGFMVNSGLNTEISSAATAPVVDGSVSEAEYGEAIWDINPDNEMFSYAQFEVGNYNATAKVYLTYDAANLYIGVVVDTPDHHNDCTPENAAGTMWEQTCIQFLVSAINPEEYTINNNWDNTQHPEVADANLIHNKATGVNSNGETINVVYGSSLQPHNMNACNKRDGAAQLTTYEIAIPWTDIGDGTIVPEAGVEIGFSLSVNSGTVDRKFQNITIRDGGGVIGINDWSKIPTITLGE